nr:ubp1-associated protein 2a [Quercus suber]
MWPIRRLIPPPPQPSTRRRSQYKTFWNLSTANSTSTSAIDEEEEPIQNLLEPFSKDQIINLHCEAVDKHRDVADQIRKVADEDLAHRKIFVHGLG